MKEWLYTLRWKLLLVGDSLRASFFHTAHQPRATVFRRQIERLRKLLRREPFWLRGHLELGLLAVEAYTALPPEESSRMLALARVSAEAIKRLHGSEEGQEAAVAKSILASVMLFERKFPEALSAFEDLIGSSQSEMPPKARAIVFEHGAAAAMALGFNQKAEVFLRAIPPEFSTEERSAAVRWLELEESERADSIPRSNKSSD